MHTNLEIKTKTHCKGGGGQKSGVLDLGPCGDLARMFAKFRKLFLPRAQGISERTNRFRIALVEPLLNLQPASRTWQQPENVGRGCFLRAQAVWGQVGHKRARSCPRVCLVENREKRKYSRQIGSHESCAGLHR